MTECINCYKKLHPKARDVKFCMECFDNSVILEPEQWSIIFQALKQYYQTTQKEEILEIVKAVRQPIIIAKKKLPPISCVRLCPKCKEPMLQCVCDSQPMSFSAPPANSKLKEDLSGVDGANVEEF